MFACCNGRGGVHERFCHNYVPGIRALVEFVGGPRDGERVWWEFECTLGGMPYPRYHLTSPVAEFAAFVGERLTEAAPQPVERPTYVVQGDQVLGAMRFMSVGQPVKVLAEYGAG